MLVGILLGLILYLLHSFFLQNFMHARGFSFSFGNSLNLALRGTSKHNREVAQFHQTWNLMKNDQYFLGRRTKFGCYVSNRLCELKGGCCIGQNSMKPKWEKTTLFLILKDKEVYYCAHLNISADCYFAWTWLTTNQNQRSVGWQAPLFF